jgi:dienelactone hydrolase
VLVFLAKKAVAPPMPVQSPAIVVRPNASQMFPFKRFASRLPMQGAIVFVTAYYSGQYRVASICGGPRLKNDGGIEAESFIHKPHYRIIGDFVGNSRKIW